MLEVYAPLNFVKYEPVKEDDVSVLKILYIEPTLVSPPVCVEYISKS